MRTCAAAVLLLVAVSSATAYDGYDVENGGGLRGIVKLDGKAPPAATLDVSKDAQVCGTHIAARTHLVGAEGGLANVVVYLSEIEQGRPVDLEHSGTLANVECRFEPHVQTLTVGQELEIQNLDPILHNTHSYVLGGGKGNRFNLALPRQGQTIRKTMKRPGVHQVRCDAGHTWMNAYFLVFEHPYHTVTDADGRFEIGDIPPGEYTLRVWHEKLGESEVEVRVKSAQDIDVEPILLSATE